MKRTDFYTKLTVNGNQELDFLWNTLSDFTMTHTPGFYRVESGDVKRLYRISEKMYDTPQFWWVIALVNNIEDPFSDAQPGDLLTIPNVLDIYAFQKKYRVRRT